MSFLEHDGVTRELPVGDTMVGGGSQADWRLQTINLAPRHFTVRADSSGSAVLTAYGTQVVEINGEAVTAPHPLAHGDEIIAGVGIFVYLARIDAAGAGAPETRGATPADTPLPVAPPVAVQVAVPVAPPLANASIVAPAAGPAPATVPAASGTAERPPRDLGLTRLYLVDVTASVAYPLADDVVGIGRDPVNHVVVRDAATSRFHADVRRAPTGAYVFRSMGTNGSTVNEEPAGRTPRPLAEGDVIRIGGTALRFTAAPPAGVRIVPRSEVAPGPRKHQPTPIYRSDEPNTVPPPTQSGRVGRGWVIATIAAVVLAAAVAVAVWAMRGGLHLSLHH